MPKNIILMGYRGSGKTSVAEELGKELKRKVISIDKEIEKKVGPIRDFIKKEGWEKFRDIESNVIKSIKGNSLVIDAGGGFIEKKQNIENFKKNGRIIWLKASPEQIRERIKDDYNRPSLRGVKSFLDEIEEVLKKREPLYKNAADYEIDTNYKSIEEVTHEILSKLKC